MFKKLMAAVLAMMAAAAFAAVDVNKATAAELDGIKGIGPSISAKILDERKKGNFKDWNDLVERVKGIGEGNAAKFSTEGLTVNGTAFKGAAAAPTAAKKEDKPTAAAAPATTAPKKEDKPMAAPAAAAATTAAAPAAAAKPAADKPAVDKKTDMKAEKKADTKADAKPDAKADAKAEKTAKADADKQAKADAKKEKKDAKAKAAEAASAPKK
jgi:competence protein ComEA